MAHRVGPIVEAHRGDSSNAPENTIAAFKRAVDRGVEWIELDVHPTRDGKLVVIHDDKLERTTTGSGPVADHSLEEIKKLDAGAWFDPKYVGERVPALAEVVRLVAPTKTRLNIEIKHSSRVEGVVAIVAELLRTAGCEHRFVVSSFDLAALRAMRRVAPEVALALIGNGPEILATALAENIPWIHASWKTAYPDVIEAAHAHGLQVNIWTMDDPAQYEHWGRRGTDKLCTNRPERMLAAAGLRVP